VWIRNWEHNAASGLPISGATVEVRNASLVSPNTGTIIASTTTDANGMWEFTSLPDAAVDVKVISGGNIWWHKGMTKHSVDAIFYVTPIPRTDNFLRNGGFETATAAGVGPWTVTTTSPVLDSWSAIAGAGSTGTVSRDTTVHAPDSTASAKIVYSKVSGSFTLYQVPLTPPAAFRGKQVSVSVQVRQGVANSVSLLLYDGVGSTISSTSATTGSFVTLTVTRTFDAAATSCMLQINIANSDTVWVDNAIMNLGAVASTYQPEYWFPGAVTTDMLADLGVTTAKLTDLGVTTPKLADLGVTAAKIAANAVGNPQMAVGAAVANLGYTPINKAGDTMLSDLAITRTNLGFPTQGVLLFGNAGSHFIHWDGASQFNFTDTINLNTGAVVAGGGGTFKQDTLVYRTSFPTTGVLYLGNNAGTTYLYFDGTNFQLAGGASLYRSGNKVWDAANDGAGSGLDADTVDGLQPGNANGNIPISNGVANANLNADLLDGLDSTAFAKLSTAGNQTIVSNSGQLIIGVIPTGPLAGATGAQVVGSFAATGTKNRIATGHDGVEGLFHSIETPLPMFEEHGRARVEAGSVRVEIPTDFANYVDLTDYYVQVTAEDAALLYVAERAPTHFTVRCLYGHPNAAFTWHLIAPQGDMTHIERNLPLAEVPA
jgi:hypothetical protein